MKCLICGEEMKCCNDVNDNDTRIDFVRCPKCSSKATIVYARDGEILKVIFDK